MSGFERPLIRTESNRQSKRADDSQIHQTEPKRVAKQFVRVRASPIPRPSLKRKSLSGFRRPLYPLNRGGGWDVGVAQLPSTRTVKSLQASAGSKTLKSDRYGCVTEPSTETVIRHRIG